MKNSYNDMTIDELIAKRTELRSSLLQLRIDKVIRHISNPLQIRTQRRQLARVHTRIYEYVKGMK